MKEVDKLILYSKICREKKMTQRTKITPKEVQMWKITVFQALAIEAAWPWYQDTQMHETEQSLESDPHVS